LSIAKTFHPQKACHSDDIEKGIGTQSVTLTMHIENRTTTTSITESHNTELTTPTTEIVIQPGEDVKRTEDHIVDAVDVRHVPECETTDDLANIHIDESNSSDSDTMNDSCAICYETLEDGDDVTTSNCSKTFHRACIITWLMQHDTCPYCRNTFKNINDHKNIDAILGNDEKIIDCEE
jgi:Ring finger domain